MVALLMTGGTNQLVAQVSEKAELHRIGYESLQGWSSFRALSLWPVFIRSCQHILEARPVLRTAIELNEDLKRVCARAAKQPSPGNDKQARQYFQDLFQPHEIVPRPGRNPYDRGFLTGYYEPVVPGSLERSAKFSEPVLARPADLISDPEQLKAVGLAPQVMGARRRSDGRLEAYPNRSTIDTGAIASQTAPILWVRDAIELFMMQVQGSARVRLPDGRTVRLAYAGRNGQPYTSIGKLLVDRGAIKRDDMSLARLKEWVREHGQQPGEPGRSLLHENRSYIFFRIEDALPEELGPIGGAGVPLSPLASIAIDRSLWPYGLPFWIEADLPWRSATPEPFSKLLVAQDTGSAILGAARADIFFGTGARAGRLAGGIRHNARMIVFLPRMPGSTDG